MNLFIISSHVSYNENIQARFGPSHSIFNFLTDKKEKAIFINHCLDGKNKSSLFINGDVSVIDAVHSKKLIPRSLEQVILNISVILKQKKQANKLIYIGIDPVNSISGGISKIFKKIDKNIYFIVDYTDKRFDNKILNNIYKYIDKLSILLSDEIWCVSSRIIKRKIKDGVSEEKLKLVPNSPDKFPLNIKNNKNKFTQLIVVSHLTQSLDILPILSSLKKVIVKYPKTKLTIVGSGPKEQYFKKLVIKHELSENVIFTGELDHDSVLKEIDESFLGFAIYTSKNSWNYYGDSMKAREYLSRGVPVIINTIPSTSDDILEAKAGLILKKVLADEISNFIIKCIEDKTFYTKLRENAFEFARKNDKKNILTDLLFKL